MRHAQRTSRSASLLAIGFALAGAPVAGNAMGSLAPPEAGRDFGLGLVVGDPTGISGEKWLSHRTSVDFGAAWSMDGDDSLDLVADHLWYDHDALDDDPRRFALHYGIGGRLRLAERGDDRIGPRFPLGITYFADGGRMGIFMQVAPVVDLAPDTDLDVQAGLGARYYWR